jgi:hypothetical protein
MDDARTERPGRAVYLEIGGRYTGTGYPIPIGFGATFEHLPAKVWESLEYGGQESVEFVVGDGGNRSR